tara:strand:+ start:757 stop:930 length:174 start_codon:yes stop_codon:yes gene_type:complete
VVLEILHQALGGVVADFKVVSQGLLQNGIQTKIDVFVLVAELRHRQIDDLLARFRRA